MCTNVLLLQSRLQNELLSCVSAILSFDCQPVSQQLFDILIYMIALHRNELIKEMVIL